MMISRAGQGRTPPGLMWFDSATTGSAQVTTFVVPSGIYEITVQGKGPAGNSTGVNVYSGGGSGGGGYAKVIIPVSPFEVLDIVVGNVSVDTTIKRGATSLLICGAGGSCLADNGVGGIGGVNSFHGSLIVITNTPGGNGGSGATGSGAPGGAGGSGGGSGGGSYNGVGGAGASAGVFGRGGNPGHGNSGWGALGATGTESPGYPGQYTVPANSGGLGAPGLMKISW